MNFEINDSKEPIPDEEDIYGVNDIEDEDRLRALLGGSTQEQRVRRRRMIMRLVSAIIAFAFILAFGIVGLRHAFGW